jgi:hypothetical protein
MNLYFLSLLKPPTLRETLVREQVKRGKNTITTFYLPNEQPWLMIVTEEKINFISFIVMRKKRSLVFIRKMDLTFAPWLTMRKHDEFECRFCQDKWFPFRLGKVRYNMKNFVGEVEFHGKSFFLRYPPILSD